MARSCGPETGGPGVWDSMRWRLEHPYGAHSHGLTACWLAYCMFGSLAKHVKTADLIRAHVDATLMELKTLSPRSICIYWENPKSLTLKAKP